MRRSIAVHGRARARWRSSSSYTSMPKRVHWPGGGSDTQELLNTAVHLDADNVRIPEIRYQPSRVSIDTTIDGDDASLSSSQQEQYRLATVSRSSRIWSYFAMATDAIVCLPLLSVVWLAFNPAENIWPHLVNTVLGSYIFNTLVLMLGVAVGTLLIGVCSAWLVTHYEFPGRALFNWALLLPFAVPAYVIAYVYTDLLEYAGPVQSLLRNTFGWKLANEYWFPTIRSLPGAISMLTLVLYPYVYLLARAAFVEQSASALEAARVLGGNTHQRFLKVALPMARPAIIVGLAMALMETLNDFGTVDYFAVRTLSAGLYDVWLSMNNLGGGAQIASLMLVFVMMLIEMEKISRKLRENFQPTATRFRPLSRLPLIKSRAFGATLFYLLPVLLGFLIPAYVLLDYSITYFSQTWNSDFRTIAMHSVLLSATAAASAVLVGILLSYSQRLHPTRVLRTSINISSLGYAVPGAVLAIGVIIFSLRHSIMHLTDFFASILMSLQAYS